MTEPDETMDRRLWLIPLGLALLLVAALAVLFGPRLAADNGAALESIPPFSGTTESGGITSDLEGLPEAGQPTPEFALSDLDGRMVELADYRGRPVVLNFWATWCAPCRLEMPELERAATTYADDGLAVLAVNQGETAEQVSAFFDEVGLTLTALLDSDGEVGRAYGAVFLPSTFIIGPDGIVSAVHHGLISRDQLDGYLAALGEQETP